MTGFFITPSGDIGVEHGIPFPVIMRFRSLSFAQPNDMTFEICGVYGNLYSDKKSLDSSCDDGAVNCPGSMGSRI